MKDISDQLDVARLEISDHLGVAQLEISSII